MESQQYLKIEKAIIPYMDEWDEWIVSDYCFLSTEEATAVISFLNTKSIRSVSQKINRGEHTVRKMIHVSRLKLIFGVKIYDKWRKGKIVDENYPLNVPIACLKIDFKLKKQLNQLGETLAEILKDYSTKDFLKLRGFGNKKLNDLHVFLDTYGYAHLLKVDEELSKGIETTSLKRIKNGEKSSPPGEYLEPENGTDFYRSDLKPARKKAGVSSRPNLNWLLMAQGSNSLNKSKQG